MVVNRKSGWFLTLWSVLVIAAATVVAPQSTLAQPPSIIWNPKTVDGGGALNQVGFDTSIVHDSANNVHISYWDLTDDVLKYATNASGTFQVFTVDPTPGVGQYTSIAVDGGGTIHISYYDASSGDLKYARGTPGAFVSTIVDEGADDGLGNLADVGRDGTSIALDSGGNVHVSYYDFTNGQLLYATFPQNGPFPVTPTIVDGGLPNDAGQYSSIAIDSADRVHISYYDAANQVLKYANNAGGVFATITVDDGGGVNDVGLDSSIALDSGGSVHISYYDATDLALKYANNAGGLFVAETIDFDPLGDVGEFSSIAIDSADNVHISYRDFQNGALKYTTNASGVFAAAIVDSSLAPNAIPGFDLPDQGLYTHITMDTGNHVHISYQDGFALDLRHVNSVRNRVADFNADGKSDIAWYRNLNGLFGVWFMNGTAAPNVAAVGQSPGLNHRVVGLGDFNNDNNADVLWRDSVTGQMVMWLMNGSTISSVNNMPIVPLNWIVRGVGDFNGDGSADILWRDASTNRVAIWIMNAALPVSFPNLGIMPAEWSIEKTGDFDGDGTDDILWRNNLDGRIFVWKMNGGVRVSTQRIRVVGDPGLVIQDVGDVNADGTSDVILKHTVTGALQLWTMTRGSVAISAIRGLGAVPNLNWVIEAVGDVNADNKADIIWRHAVNGTLSLLVLNGPSVVSSTSPGSQSNLDWRIVN